MPPDLKSRDLALTLEQRESHFKGVFEPTLENLAPKLSRKGKFSDDGAKLTGDRRQ